MNENKYLSEERGFVKVSFSIERIVPNTPMAIELAKNNIEAVLEDGEIMKDMKVVPTVGSVADVDIHLLCDLKEAWRNNQEFGCLIGSLLGGVK